MVETIEGIGYEAFYNVVETARSNLGLSIKPDSLWRWLEVYKRLYEELLSETSGDFDPKLFMEKIVNEFDLHTFHELKKQKVFHPNMALLVTENIPLAPQNRVKQRGPIIADLSIAKLNGITLLGDVVSAIKIIQITRKPDNRLSWLLRSNLVPYEATVLPKTKYCFPLLD